LDLVVFEVIFSLLGRFFPFTLLALTTGCNIDTATGTLIVAVHKHHFALKPAKIAMGWFHMANYGYGCFG
jgi:hypothetical protein